MGIRTNFAVGGTLTNMARDVFANPTTYTFWTFKEQSFANQHFTVTSIVGNFPGSAGIAFGTQPSQTAAHRAMLTIGGGSFQGAGTGDAALNQWVSWSVILNASNNVQYYADGVNVFTFTNADVYTHEPAGFRLGELAANFQHDSIMAEVCFFDRLLALGDIQSIAAGTSPMAVGGGPPMAYWRLLDNSDQNDVTGNYPLGTINAGWTTSTAQGHPPVDDPPVGPVGAKRKLINKNELLIPKLVG